DGNLWFTNGGNVEGVARITPTGVVTDIPVPSSGQIYGITTGPDGNVWFTNLGRNLVGRVDLH
ncbi:MAG: Virginiamycin B lyase, partial [Acidimicrobiia bacterium]|nr:Virginiamycin B lyase [Acidimicrobiia bacterium]